MDYHKIMKKGRPTAALLTLSGHCARFSHPTTIVAIKDEQSVIAQFALEAGRARIALQGRLGAGLG